MPLYHVGQLLQPGPAVVVAQRYARLQWDGQGGRSVTVASPTVAVVVGPPAVLWVGVECHCRIPKQ